VLRIFSPERPTLKGHARRSRRSDIPVIGNVNLGHAGPNLPLPLGVRAAIDADALTIALVEAAVA
jgi:muramoyltetrapeptide carboxypeptidase LdcA involved in peptidoglycan recycling